MTPLLLMCAGCCLILALAGAWLCRRARLADQRYPYPTLSGPVSPWWERAFAVSAALFAVTLVMLAWPAQAAGGTVDLSPVVNELVGIGVALAGAGLAWVGRRVLRLLGQREDGLIRDYLDRAMYHGLAYAQGLALERAKDLSRVEVRDQLVRDAAQYVVDTVPDALRRFDVDREGLLMRLRARLPDLVPLPGQPQVTGTVFGVPDRLG